MIMLRTKVCLAVACLALFAPQALAQKKGGGGTTPPPPVISTRFRVDLITFGLDQVAIRGFNNLGTVVGHFGTGPIRAFMFDGLTQSYYDFNSDASLQPVRDQLAAQLLSSDWVFGSARGVNDLGQVVGRVDNWVTGEQRGFALDTFNLSPPATWQLRLLPDFPGLGSRGSSIALNGRVLGETYNYNSNTNAFFICNPWESNDAQMIPLAILFQGNVKMNSTGHLAGIASDLTLFTDVNPIAGLPNRQPVPNVADCTGLGGINVLGELAVIGRLKTGPKRTDWTSRSLLRISSPSEVVGASSLWPWGINFDADIVANDSLAYKGSQTVTKQLAKVVNLINNIDPSKPMFSNTNNTVTVTQINDRDATGFGQMAGQLRIAATGTTVGFVLTPMTPIAN